jgi:hypothetical protein
MLEQAGVSPIARVTGDRRQTSVLFYDEVLHPPDGSESVGGLEAGILDHVVLAAEVPEHGPDRECVGWVLDRCLAAATVAPGAQPFDVLMLLGSPRRNTKCGRPHRRASAGG